MTLDQLRIFVAVAERRHVTRGAEALGMTQSAASAAIAALEARYATRLFHRVGRGIELSETGAKFLPEARKVLERMAAARSALEELSDVASGAVSVAASQTIANYWLPRRLAAYKAEFPRVTLDVVIGNTRQVETAVAEGAADLGLVEGPTKHPALLRRRVDEDRLVLVTSPACPAPAEISPGVPDLRTVSWVVREVGSGTRGVLEELARAGGLDVHDLRVTLVLPGNEAVREAVEAGAGATVISEHVVRGAILSGRLLAVPLDLPPREFALVRHPERHVTPAQERLMSLLTRQSAPEPA